jgi:hypothetical protein
MAALERYATSKLLVMASTVELARRLPATRFVTLDPGLMPGTGLVRMAPWAVRMAWNTVLKWAVPVLPGASTPERSAEAARRILLEPRFRSGETLGVDGMPARVWGKITDPAFGKMVLDQSLDFLKARDDAGLFRQDTLPRAARSGGQVVNQRTTSGRPCTRVQPGRGRGLPPSWPIQDHAAFGSAAG